MYSQSNLYFHFRSQIMIKDFAMWDPTNDYSHQSIYQSDYHEPLLLTLHDYQAENPYVTD